jgi:hypothetical protein
MWKGPSNTSMIAWNGVDYSRMKVFCREGHSGHIVKVKENNNTEVLQKP